MKNMSKLIVNCIENFRVKEGARVVVPAGTVLLNREGTAKKSPECPNCGAWINHWHKFSDENVPSAGDCPIKGCTGWTKTGCPARIEGCHVIIKGSKDKRVFIAPLCQCCNQKSEDAEMVLARPITLVWSNVDETCARLKEND